MKIETVYQSPAGRTELVKRKLSAASLIKRGAKWARYLKQNDAGNFEDVGSVDLSKGA